mmetsp:Transcript_93689/g.269828  ORF Transcript_93689/g.269828 Transcript_93689/m.269828 type:complete len:401 (+) Transcript_93689:136-1338(+)
MPTYTGNFYYDEKAGYLVTAVRLRHTVILAVLQRRAFWVLLTFHLLVNFVRRSGFDQCLIEENPWHIGWHSIKVISTMTIFFEVFYTNECWKRYTGLYSQTREMLHTTYDFITELRLLIGRTSKRHLRLSVRYLMSAVMLFFYEMDNVVNDHEWAQLLKLGLITEDEIRVLQNLSPPEKNIFLVHWSADVACDGHALAMEKKKVPPNMRKSLLERLLMIRHLQHQVRDVLGLPVPFQYFHLLNWMIVLNLMLWAYHMGCSISPIDTLIYTAASMVFMGMMELASAFADPFGNDEVDFPVGSWMTEWLRQCVTLLEYTYPGESDEWEEALNNATELSKDLIDVNIFMDCGFADSPRAAMPDDPRRFSMDWSWNDQAPAAFYTYAPGAEKSNFSTSSDEGSA